MPSSTPTTALPLPATSSEFGSKNVWVGTAVQALPSDELATPFWKPAALGTWNRPFANVSPLLSKRSGGLATVVHVRPSVLVRRAGGDIDMSARTNTPFPKTILALSPAFCACWQLAGSAGHARPSELTAMDGAEPNTTLAHTPTKTPLPNASPSSLGATACHVTPSLDANEPLRPAAT